jgi:ADP-ribose pyrophosphatase
LSEEEGITAGELIALGQMQLDTSIIKAPVSLYLARSLTFGEPQREGTETIKTVKLKFDEAVRQVLNSEIAHGPSCVLILKAAFRVWHHHLGTLVDGGER